MGLIAVFAIVCAHVNAANNINNNNNQNYNNNFNIYWGNWIPGIPFWSYCNGVFMDPYAQVCCGGQVHVKQAFHKCCGSGLYNTLSSKCENGAVQPITYKCGDLPYDLVN